MLPRRFLKVATDAVRSALREGRTVRVLVLAGEGVEDLVSGKKIVVAGHEEPVAIEYELAAGPPRVVAVFFVGQAHKA